MMEIINIIKNYDIDYLIMSFDRVISTKKSQNTISVFDDMFDSYYFDIKKILNKLLFCEKDEVKKEELWYRRICFLNNYYDKSCLYKIKRKIEIKKDFINLYYYLIANNIKLVICSSGYGEVIKYILKNNDINNYELISNGKDTKLNSVVTPYNKNKYLNKYSKNITIGNNLRNENTILTIQNI